MFALEWSRRNPMNLPGRLVYSAQIDQEKLECFYCCSRFFLGCCGKQEAARRSFLDIYTNGIMTNTPSVCCSCVRDRTNFMFWDDPRIGNTGKAGCCTPCPYPCPHYCGCCGEVFYVFRCCSGPPDCDPLYMGHTYMCTPMLCCACCIVDLFFGLAEGEADKIVQVMAQARIGAHPLAEYPPIQVAVMGGAPMMAVPAEPYPPNKGV